MKNKNIILIGIFSLILIAFIYNMNYSVINEDNYEVHRYCSIENNIKGIDVSYYQGTIDWNKVKSNQIEFAFIRVSDGLTKIDPKFSQNWKGSKDAGIIRGAYQFFRPNQNVTEQAKLFIQEVEKAGGFEPNDLPSVIDIEVSSGYNGNGIANKALEWINYIENHTKKKVIIYSGPYFWENNNIGSDFKDYSLWTAHYTKKGECPFIPDPWDKWDFWQFTGSGRVEGVKSIVDINVYNGSIDQLGLFINESNIMQEEDVLLENNDVVPVSPADVLENKDVILQEEIGLIFKEENNCSCSTCKGNLNNTYLVLTTIIFGLLIKRRKCNE